MGKIRDDKWARIEAEREKRIISDFERRAQKHTNKQRARLSKLLAGEKTAKSLPIMRSHCEVKGCLYPATTWANTGGSFISSCRAHASFYEWEGGKFIDSSIMGAYAQDLSAHCLVNRHIHDADNRGYSTEGLFLRGHMWSGRKITFVHQGKDRYALAHREKVADVFITTNRLEIALQKAEDVQIRRKTTNTSWKEEIEALKNIPVGESLKFPPKDEEAKEAAKKLRVILRTRRATMFSQWSVVVDLGGFLIVKKTKESIWGTDYAKPLIMTTDVVPASQKKLQRILRKAGITPE